MKDNVERQLGPGVWVDQEGGLHFNLAEILAHGGIADTPENRELAALAVQEVMKSHGNTSTPLRGPAYGKPPQ